MREEARRGYARQFPGRQVMDAERERRFRRHWEEHIFRWARSAALQLPRYAAATAVMLFKRFCLHSSLWEYDVEVLARTCVYVAGKVEENYRAAVRVDAEREEAILAHELVVLEGVRFQAVCHHPYALIAAAFPDFSDWPRVDAALVRTDAALLLSPAALAMVLVGRELGYHHAVWNGHERERERSFALVERLMQQAAADDEVAHSDGDGEALYSFYLANRNPLLNPNSPESLAQRQTEAAALEQQRQRHREQVRARERQRAALLTNGDGWGADLK